MGSWHESYIGPIARINDFAVNSTSTIRPSSFIYHKIQANLSSDYLIIIRFRQYLPDDEAILSDL